MNSSDRRDSSRYSTSWVGRLTTAREQMRVVDASESGLFLAVKPSPPVGTTLIIEVIIDGKPMVVAGEVVRQVSAPPGAPMPSGVGIKLTRKPDGWKQLVSSLAGN